MNLKQKERHQLLWRRNAFICVDLWRIIIIKRIFCYKTFSIRFRESYWRDITNFMTMRFLQTVLTAITIIYYHYCSAHKNVINQTLYDNIMGYFFPKGLRNSKIKMDRYLCHSTLPHHVCCQFTLIDKLCCQCTKICKYYGTCFIDAFFDNSNTSVEEYVTLFLIIFFRWASPNSCLLW